MEMNQRENRAFRTAKLERTITEKYIEYIYDEQGNIDVDDATGEPLTKEVSKSYKIFVPFKYNLVNQAQLQKLQYISNIWNQDCTFTIKTYDNIDISSTDRVIINDKAYTIDNVYKDLNDSSASMFAFKGYCTIYIGLKGSISL